MSHHIIQPSDIVYPVIIEKEIAGSYGNGSNKTLLCRTMITGGGGNLGHVETRFVIQCGPERVDRIVFLCLDSAIDFYNELP